jgi:hypothetical protein
MTSNVKHLDHVTYLPCLVQVHLPRLSVEGEDLLWGIGSVANV